MRKTLKVPYDHVAHDHVAHGSEEIEEEMEDFKTLSVSGLCTFLGNQGISTKTLDNFSTNMVSGMAMTHLDEGEIKELVPIIGDRAILHAVY